MPRYKVAGQVVKYIQSCSTKNDFLGNDNLLEEIRTHFSDLSEDDKAHVRAQQKVIYEKYFNSAERTFLDKVKREIVQDAAITAVGVIGGALCGAEYHSSYYGKVFGTVFGACAGGFVASCVGVGFFARTAYSDPEKLKELSLKMRPFHQLNRVFDMPNSFTQFFTQQPEQLVNFLRPG